MDHTLLIIIPIILIQLHVYITIYIYFFFSILISSTEYVMEYLPQKGVLPIREEPLNFIVQHKCVKPLQGKSYVTFDSQNKKQKLFHFYYACHIWNPSLPSSPTTQNTSTL